MSFIQVLLNNIIFFALVGFILYNLPKIIKFYKKWRKELKESTQDGNVNTNIN